MKLKIIRVTPPESVEAELIALTPASNALEEAISNLAGVDFPAFPATAHTLRKKSQELVSAAFDKERLTSESPEGPLHTEYSGWGKPIHDAPGVPRELLAADVFDFLASLMAAGDILVQED